MIAEHLSAQPGFCSHMDFEEGNPPRCPLGSGERWANGQWWACAPCFQACGLEEMKCIALPAPSQLQQPWNVKKSRQENSHRPPMGDAEPQVSTFPNQRTFWPKYSGYGPGSKEVNCFERVLWNSHDSARRPPSVTTRLHTQRAHNTFHVF